MTAFHFVLEGIDPETDCAADDIVFEVDDINRIRKIVDENGSIDDFKTGYFISEEELKLLLDEFKLNFSTEYKIIFIRLALSIDLRPYKVHTNRELYMMLKGQKPMAVFGEPYPRPLEPDLPEEKFDKYVENGIFTKHEFISELPKHGQWAGVTGIRYVLYTTKDEAWRAQAYKLMHEVSQKSGWNEGFERMEGSLLGYKDWENDVHIEIWKNNRRKIQDTGSVF